MLLGYRTSTEKYIDRGVITICSVCRGTSGLCHLEYVWRATEAVMTYVHVFLLPLCLSFYVLIICRVLIFSFQLAYTHTQCSAQEAGRIVGGLARR